LEQSHATSLMSHEVDRDTTEKQWTKAIAEVSFYSHSFKLTVLFIVFVQFSRHSDKNQATKTATQNFTRLISFKFWINYGIVMFEAH
jgi:hypothetical protein